MKFIGATIFIFLLLAQIFSKWIVVADYSINKKFIAEKLCENRDKPKLQCSGKCQLAKKLAAEEDQNNKASSGNLIAKISFSEVVMNDTLLLTTLAGQARSI
jgi:hypothetical protein